MKKNKSIIILIIPVLLIVIGIAIFFYLKNNKNLEEGYANKESDNWPELINNDSEISSLAKRFVIAVYGDGKKVNVTPVTAYQESENGYVQINYNTDIYLAGYSDSALFIFKNHLFEGNINTTIDYKEEGTHIEQPKEKILLNSQILINTLKDMYSDYAFDTYKSSDFAQNEEELYDSLQTYIKREDGFSQLSVSAWDKNKTNIMSIVILLQDEQLIGVAIQQTYQANSL